MFSRRRLGKGRRTKKNQKKNEFPLPNAKSMLALTAGRNHSLFYGKEKGHKIFDKSHQNLNALSDFDACVEACDALAASSGRVPLTSLNQSHNDFVINDCSVFVSPDGALLFQPKAGGAQGSLMSCASSSSSNSSKGSIDEETKSTDSKQNDEDTKSIESETNVIEDTKSLEGKEKICTFNDTDADNPTDELFPGEEYESAIVMGNDMTPGSDKAINGFSAKGWNPHLATASIRQTVVTLEATANFVEELILSRKNSAASTNQACDKLRDMLIVQDIDDNLVQDMDDNLEEEALAGMSEQLSEKETESVESDEIQESNVSDKENSAPSREPLSPTSNASAKSQAGPLLFPGSTLHEALVAMDQYYSKVGEEDARRWKMASFTTGGLPSNEDGALPLVQQAAQKAGERAARREKGLMDMQLILAEAELILKTRKDAAKQLWVEVHKAEEEVNRRLEEITRERSRQREQERRKEENKRQAAISDGTLESTVTQQEIWDLVSKAALDMDGLSFAPTGLPAPKVTGPIDKSIAPKSATKGSNTDAPGQSVLADANDAREKIENELGLNRLRIAAVEADEDVKDTSAALLNVLSVNDTTKRSACIAAEACLLSSAHSQANCLRSLVKIERESIVQRLQLIEDLEKKISCINIRKDLNKFIEHDKMKVPLGSTRIGEDDDGGVASALAVLNCHSDSISGIGVADNAEMSSFSGWSDDEDVDEVIDREAIEASVEDFFTKDKTFDSAKLKTSVQLLVKAVSEKSVRARGYRASTCYALNQHRGRNTKIYHEEQFEGLCEVLNALLTGCDRESADVASTKMSMMLAQTFYITREVDNGLVEGSDVKIRRIYPNKKLCNHPIWGDEDFWVQALFQCVMESLTKGGVMLRVRVKKSEATRKMKWHDLSLDERAEAASQVHAVIFAQLGALAHSMIEFGCTVEQAVSFVRRLSVRHQLPLSQRTMLLSHLMEKKK